jgi:hypothetical protein
MGIDAGQGRGLRRISAFAAVVALSVASASCSSDAKNTVSPVDTVKSAATNATTAPDTAVTPTDPSPPATEAGDVGVRAVPADYETIQAAVDASVPGDLILISPGVYNEAVEVVTENLTIRGLDRNTTILDGQFTLTNGFKVSGASGVAIENLTARNYVKNGFFWTGATGYRASYLTAFRNGDYGVYAFLSTNGLIEHSYGAGSPDAGFYIGACYPCDSVINDVVSEYNGLGYSGTNSGGNLYIINSTFRFNRAGIVPNSGSYELCYPERDSTIVGNLVYSNNQPDTPAIDVALLAMGNGILSAGGVGNVIERNLVFDHDKTGIGLVPFLEEDPNDAAPAEDKWSRTCEETQNDPAPDPADVPDVVLWDSFNNKVQDNVLSDNRVADIAVDSAGSELASLGNCFSGNEHTTSAPTDLELLGPCEGAGNGGDWTLGILNVITWLNETHPPSQDYKTSSPEPADQANMPDAATLPATPATDAPEAVDIASIKVPAKP